MTPQHHDTSPIAHSIKRAAAVSNCGRSMLYSEMKAGRLPFIKVRRKTLILDSDLRAWLESHRQAMEAA